VIGRLSGVILEQASDGACVLDVSGVGYEVFVPLRSLGRLPIGAPATVHVHTHVREEAFTLYGFTSAEDRAAFRILIGVSGVGPKLALTVLSDLSAVELSQAIARGDRQRLEAISGVGKKTAARLLLELKDKMPNLGYVEQLIDLPVPAALSDTATQVCDALTHLGFSRAQAEAAVAKVSRESNGAPVETLLRHALATLG
jgi:Holliday junction DNA helicase RuvA